MKNIIVIVLKKNVFIDVIENINFQNDFFISIEMTKHRNRDYSLFEKMKNFIANLNSLKKNVFYDQFIYAFNDFREIFNESFVKIAKTQEFLYFFEIKRNHSVHYDLHFF